MSTITDTSIIRAAARLVLRGRIDQARALDLLCAAECAARGLGSLDDTSSLELGLRLRDALELEREVAELAGAITEHGHSAL